MRNKVAAGTELKAVEVLEEKLANAESLIQDYRDENSVLKCELREIQVKTEIKIKDADQFIILGKWKFLLKRTKTNCRSSFVCRIIRP